MKITAILISALLLCGCSKNRGVAGQWAIHCGGATDTLTLQDNGGVLTGKISLDPRFLPGECDVHGVRAGAAIELSYSCYSASSTPGMSGNVAYTFKGSVNGDSMSGSFSVLGPFSSQVSNPNETALWVAERK
jgi:hypothetical protein